MDVLLGILVACIVLSIVGLMIVVIAIDAAVAARAAQETKERQLVERVREARGALDAASQRFLSDVARTSTTGGNHGETIAEPPGAGCS